MLQCCVFQVYYSSTKLHYWHYRLPIVWFQLVQLQVVKYWCHMLLIAAGFFCDQTFDNCSIQVCWSACMIVCQIGMLLVYQKGYWQLAKLVSFQNFLYNINCNLGGLHWVTLDGSSYFSVVCLIRRHPKAGLKGLLMLCRKQLIVFREVDRLIAMLFCSPFTPNWLSKKY